MRWCETAVGWCTVSTSPPPPWGLTPCASTDGRAPARRPRYQRRRCRRRRCGRRRRHHYQSRHHHRRPSLNESQEGDGHLCLRMRAPRCAPSAVTALTSDVPATVTGAAIAATGGVVHPPGPLVTGHCQGTLLVRPPLHVSHLEQHVLGIRMHARGEVAQQPHPLSRHVGLPPP